MKASGVRARRWSWVLVLAVLGVVGLTIGWWLPPLQGLVGGYLRMEWSAKDQRASVFGMVFGGLSLLWSVWSGVAQLRQARQPIDPARNQLDPRQDADRRLRAHLGPTQRLPRMATVSQRRAGVHASIPGRPQPSGAARRAWWAPWRTGRPSLDPDLPLFVERDLWQELLQWMERARRDGGFLLLVGTSSVGKTRLLFEAARSGLGDFRAVIPDLGDGGLVNALAADGPREPVIVWLDELQRFLPGPYFATDQAAGHIPLTATAIRHLLDSNTPAVVLGTLWPAYVNQLRITDTQATRPRYPQAVDILNLVTLNLTVSSFTRTEREAAARLASEDPRLATAVANQDYNVTETLAGVPAILRRYHEALPEHQAVIHAAVDARRMGIQGPLTTDLLRDAARGYLTNVLADDTWFDQVLHSLTRSDRRDDAATAPLIPLPDNERRAVVGFTIADYLLQYLLPQRRSLLLSEITWCALEQHTHNHDDLSRLADSAYRRMQFAIAFRIHSALPDTAATRPVSFGLACLLAEQGKVDELRSWADAGNFDAAHQLALLLGSQGRVDELRAWADAGNDQAAEELASLLGSQGRVDELRALADAGNTAAPIELARTLLNEYGMVDEATAVIRRAADAGNDRAATQLAQWFALTRQVDELRALAEAGNPAATIELARTLLRHECSMVDEAVTMLHPVAIAGNTAAAEELAPLLASQGRVDELRTLADAGHAVATRALARRLARQGKVGKAVAVLRPAIEGGDIDAGHQLAELLASQGRVDELRAWADAGNDAAAEQLVELLVERGNVDEATAVLRRVPAAGSGADAFQHAWRLAKQGRVDELRALADAGHAMAVRELAKVLRRQGEVDEATAVLRRAAAAGNARAGMYLVEWLAEQGEADELWQEVHAGSMGAADRLANALDEQGSRAAKQLRQWGLNARGDIAQPW